MAFMVTCMYNIYNILMQFEGKSLHGEFLIISKVVQKDKNTLKLWEI